MLKMYGDLDRVFLHFQRGAPVKRTRPFSVFPGPFHQLATDVSGAMARSEYGVR